MVINLSGAYIWMTGEMLSYSDSLLSRDFCDSCMPQDVNRTGFVNPRPLYGPVAIGWNRIFDKRNDVIIDVKCFSKFCLWISSGNMIIKYDTEEHKVVGQFFGPFQRLENLAHDGTHLWGASFGGVIYKMNPNWFTVESVQSSIF